MTTTVPEYLIDMVRREAPVVEVVPGSTPVVAFGDPFVANAATLGINPSSREFRDGEQLLDGPSRRLATLRSLGAESLASLTDEQVLEVVEDCARYFDPDRNPYRRWFDPLDRVLRASVGASYYERSATSISSSGQPIRHGDRSRSGRGISFWPKDWRTSVPYSRSEVQVSCCSTGGRF